MDGNKEVTVQMLYVALYELIAGILLFDSHTLREYGINGARKVICQQDPQTPSTKLDRSSFEGSMESARRRRINSKQSQRRLRGDLEWITLKAKEEDRTHFSATATGDFGIKQINPLDNWKLYESKKWQHSVKYKIEFLFYKELRAQVTNMH